MSGSDPQPDAPRHPRRLENPKAKRPKGSRGDVEILLQASWDHGAWIEKRGSGHFAVFTADGKSIVIIPATPSDHRAIRNARSQLRRAGIDPSLKRKR